MGGRTNLKRINAVFALITDKTETKVLMVRNIDNDQWTLPGGAVEDGEFLDIAVIREAKEETGYDIEVQGIVSINEAVLLKFNEHACFFTFSAEIIGGSREISRPDEISEIAWVDLEKADELMPFYKPGLQKIVQNGIEVAYVNQGKVS